MIVSGPGSIRVWHSTGKHAKALDSLAFADLFHQIAIIVFREICIIRIKQIVRAGNSVYDYVVVPGFNLIVDPAWDWSLDSAAHLMP